MKFPTSIPVSPPLSNPLPPYLRETEPMEIEQIPLQVSLLTMEIAAQRQALERLAALFEAAATCMKPASLDDA